jgi:hypothetical protein
MYHVANELNDKGFPEHPKKAYEKSHKKADAAEKKKYPKGYEELKKIDRKLGKNELIGKNTKSGKIEVSKKAPRNLRPEIAMHERTENKLLRKKR